MKRRESVEAGMFVRRYGPSRGARGEILFIHGLGDWGETFEVLVGHPALGRFRLLVPDLPGYGRSPLTGDPAGLDALADFLAAWLRSRGKGPVAVVGHSMGGVLGQILAERNPECVSILVNVEGNICEEDCTLSRAVTVYGPDDFLREGLDQIRLEASLMAQSDPSVVVFARGLRLCDPRAFYLHAREIVELSRRNDLARRMAALPLPACFLAASPKGASPRAIALLRSAGARLVIMEDCGHCPFHDRPDEFGTLLGEILEAAGQ
ncbi:MAG: alpha/beta fold hydrolase [Acidobacteriota bacterium]